MSRILCFGLILVSNVLSIATGHGFEGEGAHTVYGGGVPVPQREFEAGYANGGFDYARSYSYPEGPFVPVTQERSEPYYGFPQHGPINYPTHPNIFCNQGQGYFISSPEFTPLQFQQQFGGFLPETIVRGRSGYFPNEDGQSQGHFSFGQESPVQHAGYNNGEINQYQQDYYAPNFYPTSYSNEGQYYNGQFAYPTHGYLQQETSYTRDPFSLILPDGKILPPAEGVATNTKTINQNGNTRSNSVVITRGGELSSAVSTITRTTYK